MIPEQNAKNDTTMLLVRMSTDSTADGVTLSSAVGPQFAALDGGDELRTREHGDEVRVAVDQPGAGDRRHDEQQRDRQQVHAHGAHRGGHAIAHQRQQYLRWRVARAGGWCRADPNRRRRDIPPPAPSAGPRLARAADFVRGAPIVVHHGERIADVAAAAAAQRRGALPNRVPVTVRRRARVSPGTGRGPSRSRCRPRDLRGADAVC